MRGTSGTPRHSKRSRYRCSLPGLAGFAGLRRTEPEVPRIVSRFAMKQLQSKSSTATRAKKENQSSSEITSGWPEIWYRSFSSLKGTVFVAPASRRLFRAAMSRKNCRRDAGATLKRRVGDLDERRAVEQAFAPDCIEVIDRFCGDRFLHGFPGSL
jgi:hypothetical protein